jgi:hypothetical protein
MRCSVLSARGGQVSDLLAFGEGERVRGGCRESTKQFDFLSCRTRRQGKITGNQNQ